MHYLAFNNHWFKKHQRKLLWLLKYSLFRKILRIDTDKKIVEITPNSYTVHIEKDIFQTDFRTHDKYSKRLYYAFKPIWWGMHLWDLFVDIYIPKLSFGFSTLTAFPDAATGATTMDATIEANSSSWANTTSAITGVSNATLANSYVMKNTKNSAVDWLCRRGFFHFDTSSLTSPASISSAVFSLSGQGTAPTNTDSTSLTVVQSIVSTANSIVDGDYGNVNSTVFATMLLSAWTSTSGVYNDFTLDSNGIANIQKTGVTKYATRGGLDISGTPTGANDLLTFFADQAGTSTDPKLVVTYSLGGAKLFALLGVG